MSYASKRRESSSDDEGGGANWMDTYGDLVTLLLCFFVLLFAFSSMDNEKWQSLVNAFTGTPSISVMAMDPSTVMEDPIKPINTTKPEESENTENPTGEVPVIESDGFNQLYENVKAFIDGNEWSIELIADEEAFILTMHFGENILFNSGDATILPEAVPVLDQLIELFVDNQEYYDMIRIEGHTDNNPIHTAQYPSNWQLSSARALNTLLYIEKSGKIDMTKLMSAAYSEYQPIADNETAEGRAENRRVDFVIEGVTN